MNRFLFRACFWSLLVASLSTLGCSNQLSEEETPVVGSDEDEPAATTHGPDNP